MPTLRIALLLLACLCAGVSHAQGPADAPARVVRVSGFDTQGEPVIRVMQNGELRVVFNFMPPSWYDDAGELGPFRDFDKQLEKSIGVPVVWEEREFFVIHKPAADSVERISVFLHDYRKNYTGKGKK